jgi:hypothetical protein
MPRITASFICCWLLVVLPGCGVQEPVVRFATFNASLNRDRAGQLVEDLSTPGNQQARNVAEIIQRVRPDVLLINEFDYEESGRAPKLFQANYLSVSQHGAEPIHYPHRVYLPVNTGIPSGHDLDNDGRIVTTPGTRGYGNDSVGFGQFPGQYGMLLLSKFPIENRRIRTFRKFLWKDMWVPNLPTKPDGSQWYPDEALGVLRLSSKSHWDVPLKIGRRRVHVLASHPTPPAFDGPEDRNGKRNWAEIGFWNIYVNFPYHPNMLGMLAFTTDDRGLQRGIEFGTAFVILGDLNADPHDGDSVPGTMQMLLENRHVNASFVPASQGAVEASQLQGRKNEQHRGEPRFDTADFADTDPSPGNLRVDYVLPSKQLGVIGGGVFWPVASDPLHRLVEMNPVASSDHRMVWLDVAIPGR